MCGIGGHHVEDLLNLFVKQVTDCCIGISLYLLSFHKAYDALTQ